MCCFHSFKPMYADTAIVMNRTTFTERFDLQFLLISPHIKEYIQLASRKGITTGSGTARSRALGSCAVKSHPYRHKSSICCSISTSQPCSFAKQTACVPQVDMALLFLALLLRSFRPDLYRVPLRSLTCCMFWRPPDPWIHHKVPLRSSSQIDKLVYK
jgi:hypothetical protein